MFNSLNNNLLKNNFLACNNKKVAINIKIKIKYFCTHTIKSAEFISNKHKSRISSLVNVINEPTLFTGFQTKPESETGESHMFVYQQLNHRISINFVVSSVEHHHVVIWFIKSAFSIIRLRLKNNSLLFSRNQQAASLGVPQRIMLF